MRKPVQELMECYQDQKLDITDKFVDGVCYTKIEGKDKTLYLTVKYDNGYAAPYPRTNTSVRMNSI